MMDQLLCCPRCRSTLNFSAQKIRCTNTDCAYAGAGFPRIDDQPVLIDFERSIFERDAYHRGNGSIMARDDSGRGPRVRLRRLLTGNNPIAPRLSRRLLAEAKSRSAYPRILIIGGGAIGAGADILYRDKNVSIVGSDVYASPNTHIVADAHFLPFRDTVFDAVWIQAVLEHVLEPAAVASEIHRVLKAEGLVYADTPFMQPVHEEAHDFSRFSLSGHRWVFRQFEEIEAGPVGGPGASLVWSIKYFFRSIGLSTPLATLATFPFFWLRYADSFARFSTKSDGACGTYFFGRRSERMLTPKDMPRYYMAKRDQALPGQRQGATGTPQTDADRTDTAA